MLAVLPAPWRRRARRNRSLSFSPTYTPPAAARRRSGWPATDPSSVDAAPSISPRMCCPVGPLGCSPLQQAHRREKPHSRKPAAQLTLASRPCHGPRLRSLPTFARQDPRMMSVEEAVAGRRSIRAFLPKPVPRELISRILSIAGRAPSGSNVQPWHVWLLRGRAREEIVREAVARYDRNQMSEREYD